MRSVAWFAVAVLVAGCAAPPIGFGSGARLPAPPGRGVIEGRTGVGVGPGRQTYQAEASAVFRVHRRFAMEGGAVFAQTRQDDDDGGEVLLNGGFPFLRPRVIVDRVSVAVGLAGMGFGGGGGGFIGGIADLQVGYGTDEWSLYAGAYRHYFELVSEDAVIASSRQVRAGGQYTFPLGRARLGVAVELHQQRDDLRNDPHQQASSYWGGALKLSFTSPSFR